MPAVASSGTKASSNPDHGPGGDFAGKLTDGGVDERE